MSRARTSIEWPESVPVLCAADLVWNFSREDGRRDLVEWGTAVFTTPAAAAAFEKALLAVIAKRLNYHPGSVAAFLEDAYKAKHPDLAWQAAAWNEAVAQLGFDVPVGARQVPKGPKRK